MIERGIFGNLELQRIRRQAKIPQRIFDVAQQCLIVRLRGEQVNTDATDRKSLVAPGRRPLAGGTDDPSADIRSNGAFGERINEASRRYNALHRMSPSNECLSPDDSLIDKSNLRLKIEIEFMVCKGATKLNSESVSRLRLGTK